MGMGAGGPNGEIPRVPVAIEYFNSYALKIKGALNRFPILE